tara:strand:+ start:1436 stop:1603 length:168 start_codon:yes stop_codon:yes gene_type:complete
MREDIVREIDLAVRTDATIRDHQGDAGQSVAQSAVHPPSSMRALPVIKADASEAR